METNTVEPLIKCRKRRNVIKTRGVVNLGKVWKVPVYCPSGSRHRGDVNSISGLCMEPWEPVAVMKRERYKQRTCKIDSTNEQHRDGQIRSSDEAVVITAERRDLVNQSCEYTNRKGKRVQS